MSLLPGVLRPPILIFGLLWILNGIAQALIEIPSSALVAEHTTPEDRGRAYATHFALTHACWLVTYPVTGHPAAAIGPERTFTVSGIVCLGIFGVTLQIGNGSRGNPTHELAK